MTFARLAGEGNDADSGWCTYESDLENAPDVEVMCGGWNSKIPAAAAVWRQGNLLHFGFEQSPSELNDAGNALLENSIRYISRFTQDRPIGQTVSVFSDRPNPQELGYLRSMIKAKNADASGLAKRFLSESLQEKLAGMEPADAVSWIKEHLEDLVNGDGGKLFAPEDLSRLEIRLREVGALDQLLAALDGERSADAVSALERHVAAGPKGSDAAGWKTYLTANARFYFFSEGAGCKFLLDPLAKARDVPSAKLRGVARADV